MAFKAWLQDNPGTCLAVLVALTVVAMIHESLARHRRRRALRALASEWGMTYSPQDRLRLASRVAERISVPGAADLDVTDVIYGSRGDVYRYIFTARYTVGIVRGKRSQVRVGTFTESRHRRATGETGGVTMAPEDLSLVEQYRALEPQPEPQPQPQESVDPAQK